MSGEDNVRVFRVALWRRWMYFSSSVVLVSSWILSFMVFSLWQAIFFSGILASVMLMLIAIAPFGSDASPKGESSPKAMTLVLWLLAASTILLLEVLVLHFIADDGVLLTPAGLISYLAAIFGHILARYVYEWKSGWRPIIMASRFPLRLPAEYEFETKAKIDLESLNAH